MSFEWPDYKDPFVEQSLGYGEGAGYPMFNWDQWNKAGQPDLEFGVQYFDDNTPDHIDGVFQISAREWLASKGRCLQGLYRRSMQYNRRHSVKGDGKATRVFVRVAHTGNWGHAQHY